MSVRVLSSLAEAGYLLGVNEYTRTRAIYSSLNAVLRSSDRKTDPEEVTNALIEVTDTLNGDGIGQIDVPGRVAHPDWGNTLLLYVKRSNESDPTVIFDVETDDFYVDTLDEYRKVVGI